MEYQGVLKKMRTENLDTVQYYLDMKTDFINMNQLLQNKITLSFAGYECLSCHLEKEIYRQGFCKKCFFETPNAGDWIMRPELSKAHLDIQDRDLAYEKSVQLKPHIVYLANSSNVKVGVTRKTQVPTRWIDQGAHEAIEIVEVPNRYLAGITEVALKAHVADKTNWRKMLKNDIEDESLLSWKEKLKAFIPEQAQQYIIENNKETAINFPVDKYPLKPKSLNIVKSETYTGVLVGVKGQYLIFEDDTVFNVRSNEGLVVKLEVLSE
ncbi:DUF2797 domain-containing protein [Tenacibaculum finnmarkense genomovar finnmarkense]|uniref:DUF2797 domain-containing protein n=1 Tax=Tenacibaculum finnmarkense TaxID=2781243 RepID=UPI001E3E6035|nr:DUF2797 domain-containing protein [Tenacibaculum finnmarkense]MCD8416271.1 DUF2797 domain-containing protein [Tenacibaculum finnmarkense genomovar finnmarkense]MCG8184931.1 DUF2797 domain-containing protein [Tenacibaculum finnmarkense genomovar finnmarkense]MCG8201235.1 DUF2797 domain-containing protein [Tenacibaculum finnmarkense genomovar finnmarkense]MCG8208890.1 DUF2797 domain-containing protein [Tenacibaculum finnmarkense genomovar finnmarkense]MCG8211795.1 DUF2797 domain-containing pr